MITDQEVEDARRRIAAAVARIARIGNNVVDLPFIQDTADMLEYRIQWITERDGCEPPVEH
jgi:hypothetical protein